MPTTPSAVPAKDWAEDRPPKFSEVWRPRDTCLYDRRTPHLPALPLGRLERKKKKKSLLRRPSEL